MKKILFTSCFVLFTIFSTYSQKNNVCTVEGSRVLWDSAEICLVTVDTSIHKNLIIWEKPFNKGIETYNIYKLINTSYELIGSVPYDSLGIFVDQTSNPDIESAYYKISVTDTNGVESSLSAFHSTIHLEAQIDTAGGQVNLTWNEYEMESAIFDFDFYLVHKGNTIGNLGIFDSTNAGVATNFTDILSGQLEYYLVSIRKLLGCDPEFFELCNYTIAMYDEGGDGWDGGYVIVKGNGEPIDTFSMDDCYGPEIHEFAVQNNVFLRTDYVGGNDNNENYYFIFNTDMVEVFADGEGIIPPNGGTIGLGECPTAKVMSGPYSQSLSNLEDNSVMNINNIFINEYKLNIYPNPSSGKTTVYFYNPGRSSYMMVLRDLSGRTIKTVQNISGQEYTFETCGIDPGYYFIELQGTKIFKGKLVIR